MLNRILVYMHLSVEIGDEICLLLRYSFYNSIHIILNIGEYDGFMFIISI